MQRNCFKSNETKMLFTPIRILNNMHGAKEVLRNNILIIPSLQLSFQPPPYRATEGIANPDECQLQGEACAAPPSEDLNLSDSKYPAKEKQPPSYSVAVRQPESRLALHRTSLKKHSEVSSNPTGMKVGSKPSVHRSPPQEISIPGLDPSFVPFQQSGVGYLVQQFNYIY